MWCCIIYSVNLQVLVSDWTQVLHLQVVVHPRAHELPEGVVRPLPDPAVNRHALRPEADCLGLEITLLDEQRQRWRALAETATSISDQIPPGSWIPTSTALRTSLNTERCFLLSVLALCLLQSVARAFSLSHRSSQSSNWKSWRNRRTWWCVQGQPRQTKNPGFRAYTVHVSGQLKQQGDRLAGGDSHVDVIALQQPRQFGQMSEKVDPVSFPNLAGRVGWT